MADGSVTIKALLDSSGVETGISEIESSADSLSDKLNAKAVAIGNVAADAIKDVASKLGDFFSDAIDSEDMLTKYTKTMKFAGYSDDEISSSRQAMKAYADDTVYDLNTIVSTTETLGANGVDNFEGVTESLGNLNAVAGGSSDSFDAVSLALTQIVGAGKLASGDWRQFVSNLPGASGILQQALADIGAYDPAMETFSEALSNGEISSDEFLQAIQKVGSDPSAYEAATSTDTFEGAIGNLEAAIQNGLMDVIEHFGMDNITDAINGATQVVEGAGDIFKAFGDAIGAVVDGGKSFADWIASIQDVLQPLGVGLGVAAAGMGALAIASGLLSFEGLIVQLPIISGLVSGLGDAWAGLSLIFEASPIGVVITLVAALAAALIYFFTQTETGQAIWQAFCDWLTAVWTALQANAMAIWQGICDTVSSVSEAAGAAVEGIWGGIVSTVTGIWDGLSSAASAVWNGISSTVSGVVSGISSTVSSVFSGISSTVSGVWNGIRDTISGAINGARDIVSGAVSAIKGIMNFSWSLPPLKLPHFSIDGSFSLDPPSVPHISVDWYAKGGLFNGPSIIGVGEGTDPEYALPLNRKTLQPIAEGISDRMGGAAGGGDVVRLLEIIIEILRGGQDVKLDRKAFARLVWEVQR